MTDFDQASASPSESAPSTRFRLGMLTPSSNTVLEPVTAAMLADVAGVSAHFSRFKVTEIALDAGALAQFDDRPILAAAELLADAKVDVIAWNGTSASWLGFERDERLRERIEAVTGVRARTCVLSLLDILARVGARTQALVTPYTADVQARIVATYAARGIECPSERHLGVRDNFTFGTIGADEVGRRVTECAAAGPDAVTVLCTNMDGAGACAALETADGPMLLDSVAVTLWGCLDALGLRPEGLTRWGRLFSDPRLAPAPNLTSASPRAAR